jgi:hypothetical protein
MQWNKTLIHLNLIHNEDAYKINLCELVPEEIQYLIALFKENHLQDWNPLLHQFLLFLLPSIFSTNPKKLPEMIDCFLTMISFQKEPYSDDVMQTLTNLLQAHEYDFTHHVLTKVMEPHDQQCYFLCCLQSFLKVMKQHNESFFQPISNIDPAVEPAVEHVVEHVVEKKVELVKSDTMCLELEPVSRSSNEVIVQVRKELDIEEYKHMLQCGIVQLHYDTADIIEEEVTNESIESNEIEHIQITYTIEEESKEDISNDTSSPLRCEEVSNKEEESKVEDKLEDENTEDNESEICREEDKEKTERGICIRLFQKWCGK